MREVLLFFLIFSLQGCYVSVSSAQCKICQDYEEMAKITGSLACTISSKTGKRLVFSLPLIKGSSFPDWFNYHLNFTSDCGVEEELHKINISLHNGTVKFQIRPLQYVQTRCHILSNSSGCGPCNLPIRMDNNATFNCSCYSAHGSLSQSSNPVSPPVTLSLSVHQRGSMNVYANASSHTIVVITNEVNNNKNKSLSKGDHSSDRVTVIVVPIVVVIIVVLAVSTIVIILCLKRKKLQSSADDKLKMEDPALHREDTVSGIRENVLYIPGDDVISPGRSEYAEVSNNAGFYEDSYGTDDSEVPSSSEIASTLAELDSVSQMHDDSVEGTADNDDFPIYAVVDKKRPRDPNQSETDFEKETI